MVQFRRGFKARANDIALGLRKQAGLSKTAPLDPRDVLDRLFVQVVPLSNYLDSCARSAATFLSSSVDFSAMLLRVGQNRRIILHDDSHSKRRQNSDLAHELAHILLVHPGEVVCAENLARKPDSLIEAEAAYLGGCILLPNEAAYRLAVQGVDVSKAAIRYGVSENMIAYRLRMSGALKRVQRFK